jgi:acid phosphatase type 7
MRHKQRRNSSLVLALATALIAGACGRDAVAPAPAGLDGAQKAKHTAILAGAGDIADCASTGDEQTAALLDGIGGTVFTAGDNAYENGTLAEFLACYHPSWGRHRARTRPAIGNHEYNSGAAGYFAYFAERAGPPGLGYYSYDLGQWHVVVLNSNFEYSEYAEFFTDIDPLLQKTWLDHDLDASPAACTLVYFHHPRFSSGQHGSQPQMQDIWEILYEHGVEVVVAGHDHDYERFAPMDASGAADPLTGIRQFVVGIGGKSLRDFATVEPNSEVRYNSSFGVIKFVLQPTRYHWEVLAAPGGEVVDAGKGGCH